MISGSVSVLFFEQLPFWYRTTQREQLRKVKKVQNLLSSKSSKLFEWENTRCGCNALWWSVTVQQCIPQCPSKWRKMQKHAEQSNCSMWSCVVGWQGRSTAVEFTRMFYTQRHLLLDTSLFSRVHSSDQQKQMLGKALTICPALSASQRDLFSVHFVGPALVHTVHRSSFPATWWPPCLLQPWHWLRLRQNPLLLIFALFTFLLKLLTGHHCIIGLIGSTFSQRLYRLGWTASPPHDQPDRKRHFLCILW